MMTDTAQIRIRFAMVLLIAVLTLAQGLGFEAILGAFLAGAVLRLIDADAATVHPHTELKLAQEPEPAQGGGGGGVVSAADPGAQFAVDCPASRPGIGTRSGLVWPPLALRPLVLAPFPSI